MVGERERRNVRGVCVCPLEVFNLILISCVIIIDQIIDVHTFLNACQ